MPLVDIHVIEGVFDANDKQEMISRITDTMVAIEGENLRGVTWEAHTTPPHLATCFALLWQPARTRPFGWWQTCLASSSPILKST